MNDNSLKKNIKHENTITNSHDIHDREQEKPESNLVNAWYISIFDLKTNQF